MFHFFILDKAFAIESILLEYFSLLHPNNPIPKIIRIKIPMVYISNFFDRMGLVKIKGFSTQVHSVQLQDSQNVSLT